MQKEKEFSLPIHMAMTQLFIHQLWIEKILPWLHSIEKKIASWGITSTDKTIELWRSSSPSTEDLNWYGNYGITILCIEKALYHIGNDVKSVTNLNLIRRHFLF